MRVTKQKKVFFFSVLASLLIHLAELHLLKNTAQREGHLQGKKNSSLSITKNEILKESFKDRPLAKEITPTLEKLPPLKNEAFHLEWPESYTPPPIANSPNFAPLSENLSYVFKELHSELILPYFKDLTFSKLEESTIKSSFIPKKEETVFRLGQDTILKTPEIHRFNPPLNPSTASFSFNIESDEMPFTLDSFEKPKREDFSEFFDLELVYSENEEGKIAFALTLILKENIDVTPLKQNYLFVLDRSNSVQRERLLATKNAIQRALKELKEEDQFNILVFDQRIEKMHPMLLKASSENISKAQKFLEKVELGSFFSQPNLYDPLFTSLRDASFTEEISSIILFTDGENFSQKGFAKDLVRDFTKMNASKAPLHIVSMTQDRFPPLLNTLSSINNGQLVTSSTHRGIKRKLLKLMKTIQKPIAKDLECTVISRLKEATLELYPKERGAPLLFLDEPFVLIGSTDSLDDFVVFIQGNLSEKNLHIKKNISFSSAKKASFDVWHALEKQKAKDHFLRYLENYDENELEKANEIAQNHALEVQFE